MRKAMHDIIAGRREMMVEGDFRTQKGGNTRTGVES